VRMWGYAGVWTRRRRDQRGIVGLMERLDAVARGRVVLQ
jgi:hypothetical protein